jgi:hypothetical protein
LRSGLTTAGFPEAQRGASQGQHEGSSRGVVNGAEQPVRQDAKHQIPHFCYTRTTQLPVRRQSPESKDRSRLVSWRDLVNGEMLDNKGRAREMCPRALYRLRLQ